MMPVTQVHTAAGEKTPIALDYLPTSQITAAISLTGGAAVTLLVQVTLDNVVDEDASDYVAPASARWFTVTGAPTNAAGYVTFDGPWRAIRLDLDSIDTGSVIFQVAQATTPRA